MEAIARIADQDAALLPRGRTCLSPAEVQAEQRRRILQATVSLSARDGYAVMTVASICRHARVSKNVFYELFENKEACLLAAVEAGRRIIEQRFVTAIPADEAGSCIDPVSSLRAMLRAFLRSAADEPEFTTMMFLELVSAGAPGLAARRRYVDWIADLWADAIRRAGGVSPSRTRLLATVGGISELLVREVVDGRTGSLLELEDEIIEYVAGAVGVPLCR